MKYWLACLITIFGIGGMPALGQTPTDSLGEGGTPTGQSYEGARPTDFVNSGGTATGFTNTGGNLNGTNSVTAPGATNPARRRFFEQKVDSDDPLSAMFDFLIGNPPATVLGVLLVMATLIGGGYLLSGVATIYIRGEGLPSPKERQKRYPNNADMLNILSTQYDRLTDESSSLTRRIRILFGFGILSFSVSTALIVLLIEANLNREIQNMSQSLSFLSPIVTFQVVAGFLIRQATLTQKESDSVRTEINDIQLLMSSGVIASNSDETVKKFARNLMEATKKQKQTDSQNESSDPPSNIDIRTLASLVSAITKTTN